MTKHNQKTTKRIGRQLISFMLLGIVVLAMAQPASAIELGTTKSKTLAVDADPNADEGTLGLSLATVNCKGVPVVAMACTGAVTAVIDQCVEVHATVGGFIPVSGEACFQYAGAAAVAATGSITSYVHSANARYNAFMEPYKEENGERCVEKWRSDPKVFGGGGGGKYVTVCEPTYGTYQDVYYEKAECTARTNQITEAVHEFVNDPLDIKEWMPGWEATSCPASVGTSAAFVCVELSADAHAEADLWESDDEVPGNECKSKHVLRYTEPPEDDDELSAEDRDLLIDLGVEAYEEKLKLLLHSGINDTVENVTNETHALLTRALLEVSIDDLVTHASEQMRQDLETDMSVKVVWEAN